MNEEKLPPEAEAAHRRLESTFNIAERLVQGLLVSHGAALLALITTYVDVEKPMPELIREFLRLFSAGFLQAMLALLAVAGAQIALARLHLRRKTDEVAFGKQSSACSYSASVHSIV